MVGLSLNTGMIVGIALNSVPLNGRMIVSRALSDIMIDSIGLNGRMVFSIALMVR